MLGSREYIIIFQGNEWLSLKIQVMILNMFIQVSFKFEFLHSLMFTESMNEEETASPS